MNRFTLMTAALLLGGAAITNAQFGPEPRYDASTVSALVDRVHTDLNHAYGVWHFSSGDRDRLNHSEKELREFAKKWEDGKFDKGQLDGAIDSVQHVLDDNKMPVQDRDAISEDISQLRKMREAHDRHEIEGDRH
jgi:hypothetical protein